MSPSTTKYYRSSQDSIVVYITSQGASDQDDYSDQN